MENLTPDLFFTICFDIMARICNDLQPLKKEIIEKYQEDYAERDQAFRIALRLLMGKYEPELIERYNLSFSEYNEYPLYNKQAIQEYLAKHPDQEAAYEKIKQGLKLELTWNQPKIEQNKQNNEAERRIPSKYPKGMKF
jgi:hypothetical protein